MTDKEVILLSRDVFALLVPSGARVLLHQGTEVMVTQALGNTWTVNVYGNLARIEGKDADALGKTPPDPLAALPSDASIEDKVWAALKTVYDPEIPVNIVALGLVYRVDIQPVGFDQYELAVDMTLTAPGCGMGPVLVEEAQRKLLSIPGVVDAEVSLVFDPPWDRSRLSEEAQLELGMYE